MVNIDPTAQDYLNNATTGTTVLFDMLPGVAYTGVLEHYHQNENESMAYTWAGSIQEEPDASFLLSTYNSVTVATLKLPSGDVFVITYNGDGTHQVTKLHPDVSNSGGTDDYIYPPAPNASQSTDDKSTGSSTALRGGGTRDASGDIPGNLDVLMVYTARVREMNGGTDATEALINLCIAFSNQAFINSGLSTCSLTKAGTMELDYVSAIPEIPNGADADINGTPAIEVDLLNLAYTPKLGLDIVHPLRDGIQADVVQMLVPALGPGITGLGYIGGGQNVAFSVASGVLDPYSTAWTSAHEFGHGYGLFHDETSDSIMSYNYYPRPYFLASDIPIILMRLDHMYTFRHRNEAGPKFHVRDYNPVVTVPAGGIVEYPWGFINAGKGDLNYTADTEASWLSVFPPKGTVSEIGTRMTTLTLTFDATGLAPGTYNTTINLSSAPVSRSVPVTFEVTSDLPENDEPNAAKVLEGSFGMLLDSNFGATSFTDENLIHPGSQSVWYTWQADNEDSMTIDTIGSDLDTLLVVMQGSVPIIDGINDNIDSTQLQSRVTFTPQPGEWYNICVANSPAAPGTGGIFHLNWGTNPPPPNDNVANAEIVSGVSGTVDGSNLFASLEVTDPAAIDGVAYDNSVWYSWTATSDGLVDIGTSGSTINTVLGVFSGSPENLVLIAENDDADSSEQSRVTASVEAMETYYIMVAGKDIDAGNVLLSWSASAATGAVIVPELPAMNLSTVEGIDVSPNYLKLYNTGAVSATLTASTDVPWMHVFTPGEAAISTGVTVRLPVYYDTDAMIPGTYTGNITVLSPEADNEVTTVPVTVDIQDDSLPPPNDDFANALLIEGTNGVAYSTGKNATAEGYTIHGVEDSSFEYSTWLRWDSMGPYGPGAEVTFDSSGSRYAPPNLILMSSRDLTVDYDMLYDALSLPDQAGQPRSFEPIADFTYYIYMFETNEPIQIRWGLNLPENDNFEDAKEIFGASGSEITSTVEATRQSNEPAKIAGQEASHSVWYKWTADSMTPITFNTIGSSFDTLLSVHMEVPGDLPPLMENDDWHSASNGASSVSFMPSVGETYYIRVDGVNFATGDAVLNWLPDSGVGNWTLY